MGFTASLRLSPDLKFVTERARFHLVCVHVSSHAARQDSWSIHVLKGIHLPKRSTTSKCNVFVCRSALLPNVGNEFPVLKSAAVVLTRTYGALRGNPVALQLIPAFGIIAFATWGIGPLMRLCRVIFLHRSDNSWRKSSTHFIVNSYFQPLLLWIGAILICRALDPVVLPSEASQVVKQRLVNFARSLSTVLALSFCLSCLIQQAQRFFMEMNDSTDAKNMGFDFAGKAIYTAVWVAAVSLFMELLGFSTQKWLTAGGLGTVLVTLAGREILTNFLSSVMIHATRPFVLNEWIQTKIEGYEVSGTVEHVGWWSPTVIRGDDREAIHIPNHKFTVSVVRNLSQKTHWRIKAQFAISHLDVNKINIIVADMRKVLAKNPQVEQQRLHRRVFLENVDPENQALMVLVSCFVKTSRFEEYMCVKESILLDLLRVISHHGARLATPIRTVQKVYSDSDLDNVPFAGSPFTRSRGAANRPLLLIEPPYKTSAGEKVKAPPHSVVTKEEKDPKTEAGVTYDATMNMKSVPASTTDSKSSKVTTTSVPSSSSSRVALSASQDKPPDSSIQHDSKEQTNEVAPKSSSEDETHSKHPAANLQSKADADRSVSSPVRSPLEENIVLGVALEGPKRTLPIEEEETAESEGPAERKELAGHQNGSGASSLLEKEKQDG